MEKILDWLATTHGQFKGAPIPNWVFVVCSLALIIDYCLYLYKKNKKKHEQKIKNRCELHEKGQK
ncbi:hypothetical protein AGMMS50293_19910 [Spirochaetia bacterium]|nr:hypothetical protein AGMMS50293_19910 [Spirochaetia bacterium]